ncbi:MAG: ABC transporter substrate-binding protein [Acidobacteriota bacterium]
MFLVAILALASLVACATDGSGPGDAPPASPAGGDRLVFGDTVEPTTLNCIRSAERPTRQICRLVADSLIDYDQHFNMIPRLAESFEVSPDGLAITLHLRRHVRWQDGEPFDARDVRYTIDLMKRLDPDQKTYRTYFGPLQEVIAVDAYTIRAVYTEPFRDALIGWRELFIMPAHLPFDPTRPSPLDRAPVGTGPFRFVRWDPQQQIVLEANPDYFGPRPFVQRYVQRIIPTMDGLRAAAVAGVVDVAPLSPDWFDDRRANDPDLPFRVLTYPTSLMEMIYWNLDEPRGLFRDPRVRRALTMLLDREGYISKIQHGIYRTCTTLIDPLLWGGDPDLRPYPYDPAGAARLLDEAGIIDQDGDGVRDTPRGPMSFTLIYTTATPAHRDIGILLERAAARVGIRVHLQGLEWAIMKPRVYAHDFEAAVYRWRLEPRPDPYAYFHSSQIDAGFNLGNYRGNHFDRLSEELRRTTDPEVSAALLVRLQKILHEDQPCTFVAIPGSVLAIHKRFRIPALTPAGLWNWYPALLKWTIPGADREDGRGAQRR